MKAPRFTKWFAALPALNQPQRLKVLDALRPAAGLHELLALLERTTCATRRCPHCQCEHWHRHGHANDLQRYRCRAGNGWPTWTPCAPRARCARRRTRCTQCVEIIQPFSTQPQACQRPPPRVRIQAPSRWVCVTPSDAGWAPGALSGHVGWVLEPTSTAVDMTRPMSSQQCDGHRPFSWRCYR